MDHYQVGIQMREERKKAGVSLRSLATRMKKSAAFISDLELGRRNWDEARVVAFRKALR